MNVTFYGGQPAPPYTISIDGGTALPTVSDIQMNTPNPAMQQAINVRVGGAARPVVVRINYQPKPWLIYDPTDNYYRVRFIGGGTWNGVGGTGAVIRTRAGKNAVPRMNW